MSREIIQIDVDGEIAKMVSQLHSLPDQIASPQILRNALNSVARKVRKQMVQDVKSEYAVTKQKILRGKTQGAPQVLTASPSSLSAVIRSRGPMQDILSFKTRPNTADSAASAQIMASGNLKPLETHGLKAYLSTFAS